MKNSHDTNGNRTCEHVACSAFHQPSGIVKNSQVKLGIQKRCADWRLVAGLSPRRPWFDPDSVQVRFAEEKSGNGTGFLLGTYVDPCQQHSTHASHSSSSAHYSYQNEKWVKPKILGRKYIRKPKKNCTEE